jgi:3-dehydroquinate synthase class II
MLSNRPNIFSPVSVPKTNPINDIPFLNNNLQNIKISSSDSDSIPRATQEISEWKVAFDSMDINALEILLDLVEANEMKEIESIRSEFEPRLFPILESIRDRRK